MLEFDDPKRLWYYICDEVKIMRFFGVCDGSRGMCMYMMMYSFRVMTIILVL